MKEQTFLDFFFFFLKKKKKSLWIAQFGTEEKCEKEGASKRNS